MASLISTLSTSTQLWLPDNNLPDSVTPMPEVETEASWQAKAKAAGLSWNAATSDYSRAVM
jgi:hypothetical protein